jgi:hypothetical protein
MTKARQGGLAIGFDNRLDIDPSQLPGFLGFNEHFGFGQYRDFFRNGIIVPGDEIFIYESVNPGQRFSAERYLVSDADHIFGSYEREARKELKGMSWFIPNYSVEMMYEVQKLPVFSFKDGRNMIIHYYANLDSCEMDSALLYRHKQLEAFASERLDIRDRQEGFWTTGISQRGLKNYLDSAASYSAGKWGYNLSKLTAELASKLSAETMPLKKTQNDFHPDFRNGKI